MNFMSGIRSSLEVVFGSVVFGSVVFGSVVFGGVVFGGVVFGGVVFVSGCGDDDGSGDTGVADTGGDDVRADTDPVVCNAPATSCPEDQPIIGAPCEGTLTCMYDAGRGFGMWEYMCDTGVWAGDAPCAVGGCAPPPLAERCRDPFMGSVAGSVAVGPATSAEFRAFTAGERITPVVGGQGAAMLEMALSIEGADAVSCAEVSIALSADGVAPGGTTSFVQVHCGRTRRIFAILTFPDLECGTGVHDMTIDVDVAGVGTTSATIEIEAGYLCFG